MLLYHGGTVAVESPRIIPRRHLGDFGVGFYTTLHLTQARKFAKLKAHREGVNNGVVSYYQIDDKILVNGLLKIRHYSTADREWLDFVLANRKNQNFIFDDDIVWGPVADDQVYASIALFEAGLLDYNSLIKALHTRRLAEQILFHSAAAISCLKYIKSEVVECQ